MFEMFTDRARKVMALAHQEAQRFNHEYIGTEHILLGLVKEGAGAGANVLKNLSIELPAVRLEVETLVKLGSEPATHGKLPQTPRAKKVIEYAIEEARTLNHNYVGSEHLLLGLLRERDGVAARALMNLGLKLDEVRQEVLDLVGAGPARGETPPAGKSRTPALDSFATDLTALAREGTLDPVIGRDGEVERLAQILGRRRRNSAVLVGEPGVGKTAIVRGLARRIGANDVCEHLVDCRIRELDVAMLVAGTKYRGQLEERIKATANELGRAKDSILFFDDVHATALLDASRVRVVMDLLGVLKPALEQGEVRCIAVTGTQQYGKYVKSHPILRYRFQKMAVSPIEPGKVIGILRGLRDLYEAHHSAQITDDALRLIVELSREYLSGPEPANAIELMDEACIPSSRRMARPPAEVLEIEHQIEQSFSLRAELVKSADYDGAAEARDKTETLRQVRDDLRRQWTESLSDSKSIVDEMAVVAAVSRMARIPVERLRERITRTASSEEGDWQDAT